MPSTTSLLRSAASTRNKIRNYEDSVAAFEWNLSAKTQDDYANYLDYLQRRAGEESDPSKTLSYQRTMVGAQRSFVSHEIQRSTIDILEGRGTSSEKYTKMVGLYQLAISNQDLDLAQSLRLQLDSLDIKIQNEMESAQRVAGTMAKNQVKDLEDLEKKFKESDDFIELADGTLVKSIKTLETEAAQKGDTTQGFFTDLKYTTDALTQLMQNAYQGLTTQEAAKAFEEKYSGYYDGTRYFNVLGKKLDINDITLAKQSADANNPIYSFGSSFNEKTGAAEFSLVENKIDDYVWIVAGNDADGNPLYQAVKTRATTVNAYQELSTQITDNGEIISVEGKIRGGTGEAIRDEGMSIENRLRTQGIEVVKSGDELQLKIPGIGLVEATILPGGSVRFFGDPGEYSGGQSGLYEIDILTGKTREVSPDETSDFGVQSAFGGNLSQATTSGQKVIDQLAGVATTPTGLIRNATIQQITPAQLGYQGTAFSASTSPVLGGNIQGTSGLLGQANTLQAALRFHEEEAIKLAQPPSLQGNVGTNLNQTPTRQYAQSGAPVKQLSVTSAPVSRAPIRVVQAAPARVTTSGGGNTSGFGQYGAIPTGNIGSVGVAPTYSKPISVGY